MNINTLHPDALPFLRELTMNNNREWFQANKPRYDAIKKHFEQFTSALIEAISPLDPSIAGADPKRCIYRIYRDIRFSQDKRPYKTHLSLFIPSGGVRRTGVPGYYAQFDGDPEEGSFMGGGIFMPEPIALKAIIQEIYYNVEEFKQIINNKEYKRWYPGDFYTWKKLTTVPKGYPKDWPDADLLRYKDYCAMHYVSDEEISNNNLLDNTIACFKAAVPLNKFIQRAMYELL